MRLCKETTGEDWTEESGRYSVDLFPPPYSYSQSRDIKPTATREEKPTRNVSPAVDVMLLSLRCRGNEAVLTVACFSLSWLCRVSFPALNKQKKSRKKKKNSGHKEGDGISQRPHPHF